MICPICANETEQKYRPFCSQRCANVDLARWMSGAYAVPSDEVTDPGDVLDATQDADRKPH